MPRRNRALRSNSTLSINRSRRRVRLPAHTRTNPTDQARLRQSYVTAIQYEMLPRRPAQNTSNNNLPDASGGPYAEYLAYHDGQDDFPAPSQAAISHARYHRLCRYAELREKRTSEWMEIENTATATYLWCQQYTRNWTSSQVETPSSTVPFQCTCSEDEIQP